MRYSVVPPRNYRDYYLTQPQGQPVTLDSLTVEELFRALRQERIRLDPDVNRDFNQQLRQLLRQAGDLNQLDATLAHINTLMDLEAKRQADIRLNKEGLVDLELPRLAGWQKLWVGLTSPALVVAEGAEWYAKSWARPLASGLIVEYTRKFGTESLLDKLITRGSQAIHPRLWV